MSEERFGELTEAEKLEHPEMMSLEDAQEEANLLRTLANQNPFFRSRLESRKKDYDDALESLESLKIQVNDETIPEKTRLLLKRSALNTIQTIIDIGEGMFSAAFNEDYGRYTGTFGETLRDSTSGYAESFSLRLKKLKEFAKGFENLPRE